MAAEATELKAVLETLLSPDNATRAAGEAQIAALKTATPIPLVRALLVLCGDWCAGGDGSSSVGAAPCIRSLAAVLLRRHLLEAWGDLDDATRAAVRLTLVASLAAPGPPGEPELAKLLGDCVGALAQHVGGGEGAAAAWPELPPALLAAAASQNPSAAALEALACLADDVAGCDDAFAGACASALAASSLAAADGDARRRRAKALGAVLGSVGEAAYEGEPAAVGGRGTVEAYVECALFRPARDAAGGGGKAADRCLRDGLEQMVELADAAPKAFRDVAAPVLSGCLDVAATPGFGGGARSLAVELACSLCERAPATARRCAAGGAKWPAKAVDACFEMLAEDEPRDDPAAWEHAPGPPPELDAASGRELGAEFLDRLARSLRPKAVLPRALGNAARALAAAAADLNQWRGARAACFALTQVAESVNDLESLKKTDDVPLLCGAAEPRRKLNGKRRRRDWVDALLPFATQYPVACVRCAALDALAQSCEDLGPLLQLETHAVVVPALCESIRGDGSHRARAAACRCALLFLDAAPYGAVGPHLPLLAETLAAAVAPASPPHVREHAVAAVAALAEAASYQSDGSTKVGLYGLFGPLLSPLAAGSESLAGDAAATAAVRARALETVALLGEAAGRDVFGDDAVALLRVVIRDYFGPDTRPEDDAERTGALKSVVRVAKCLGASFAPFLEDVLPYALEAAEGQQVLAGVAGDDDDSDADENDEFVVRTEALEAQANGCQSVLLLADALGGHFAGAVEKCFLTLAPLVSHAIADDVRSYAAAALPALVDCARLGDGANAAAALLFALEALLAAVAEEEDLEPLLTALQATKATIEAGCRDDGEAGTEAPRPATAASCRPLLLGTRLAPDKVLDALHGCLAASLQRRAVRRAEATMDEDYDDDAREAHEEAAALDGMVVYNVAEALGAVLRTHGASAFDALKGAWLPRLADMADERCVEHDRRVAAFVLCDVVEFGPLAPPGLDDATRARVLGEAAALVPALLRLAAEGSPARRQAAIYGVGAAASSLGPSGHFSPHAPAALASIAAAMALRPSDAALAAGGASDDDDDGDDDGPDAAADEMVADNAAAALLKVLRAAPGGGGGQARAWVSYLPLRADPEEAASCLDALCADLVQPGLLGAVPLADKVACVARCAAALRENAEGTTARVGSAQKSGASRGRGRADDGGQRAALLRLKAGLLAVQAAHRPEDLMAAWQTLPHDAQAVVSALAALQ